MTDDELRALAGRVLARTASDDCDLPAYHACARELLRFLPPPDPADAPTPERLRAAGFRAAGEYLLYGNDDMRLELRAENGEWLLARVLFGCYTRLPDLRTMAAVRAWMRAVDAANGSPEAK